MRLRFRHFDDSLTQSASVALQVKTKTKSSKVTVKDVLASNEQNACKAVRQFTLVQNKNGGSGCQTGVPRPIREYPFVPALASSKASK